MPHWTSPADFQEIKVNNGCGATCGATPSWGKLCPRCCARCIMALCRFVISICSWYWCCNNASAICCADKLPQGSVVIFQVLKAGFDASAERQDCCQSFEVDKKKERSSFGLRNAILCQSTITILKTNKSYTKQNQSGIILNFFLMLSFPRLN